MGRQQRHDRTETVEKAMNLFWQNGFTGTSMRDLEKCLDMRPGSIYANFGSKEQLYMESLDLYDAKCSEDFQGHIDRAATFMEGLGHHIKQILLDPESSCTCMLVKTLADIPAGNDALKEKAHQMIRKFENSLVTELEKARTVGDIGPEGDIRSLARFIQVQVMGLRAYAEKQKSTTILNALMEDAIGAIEAKAGIKFH